MFPNLIHYSFSFKKCIIFLVSFLSFLFVNSQQLFFNNHTTVSSGADGYGRPRIDLVSDDKPIVIFRKNSSPKTIRISKWNGNHFDSPVDIISPGIFPSSQDGPELATKGDTVYVVFTSSLFGNPCIFMVKSFDGGISFSDTIRVSENNPPQICRMGNVEIDNIGNPVISYMKYNLNFSEPKQMIRTSNDFGDTFNQAVVASNISSEPCECCKSSLIVSDSNIFVLYRNNENNKRNSHVSKSSNGGVSFDLVRDIDDYDWILNNCPTSTTNGVVLFDSLLIVKKSGATGNNEVVITSVDKENLEYNYNRNIDFLPNVEQSFPEIANSEDSIFIVWEDNRNGISNCFLSYSLSGVGNLSKGILFTDSANIGPKYSPHLAYKNGNLHLVYIDFIDNSIKYVKSDFNQLTYINHTEKNNYKLINFDIIGRKNKNSIYKNLLIRKLNKF